MKNLARFTAITALLSVNASAQMGPEYLTITLSNSSLSQPVSMTMGFSNDGDDAIDAFDTTSIIMTANGPVGTNAPADSATSTTVNPIFPFTVSSNLACIDIYDARPVFETSTSYNFGLGSNRIDTISITASAFIDLIPSNPSVNEEISHVYLIDSNTGIAYQLLNNSITLIIPANLTFAKNYQLRVIAKPRIQTFPVTCFGDSNGQIQIHNPNCTNWNYLVYDNQNNVVTSSVSNPDTLISNFPSANYSVSVYVDGYLVDSELVYVNSPAEIIPNFTADNYSVFTNNQVSFLNQTTGADGYYWTFGDSTVDTVVNPTHSFLSAGSFPVTLTATFLGGCGASFTDTIFVTNASMYQGPSLEFNRNPINESQLRTSNPLTVSIITESNKISIKQNGDGEELFVQILSMNGQLINSTSTSSQGITFNFIQAGIYLVNITNTNGQVLSEKVLVNNRE